MYSIAFCSLLSFRRSFASLILAFVTGIVLLFAAPARADNPALLHSFDGPSGSLPGALIDGGMGVLYGVASGGPSEHGVVYSISMNGNYQVLHAFDGTSGDRPQGIILASNGTLYGTTAQGGVYGFGTIFALRPSTGFELLHSFNGGDGNRPTASPVEAADGTLYGTTVWGGNSNEGVLYRITKNGDFSVVLSFSASVSGAYPAAELLLEKNGTLTGTTQFGGKAGNGKLFRFTPPTSLEVLYEFDASTGGAVESKLLEGIDGSLYGTAATGGASGAGVIFRLDAGLRYSVLHTFTSLDGRYPRAALVQDSRGTLYGAAYKGGNTYLDIDAEGQGSLFAIDSDGSFSVLHNFAGNDGAGPIARLIVTGSGDLYGTTSLGGLYKSGSLFRYSLSQPPAIQTPSPSPTAPTRPVQPPTLALEPTLAPKAVATLPLVELHPSVPPSVTPAQKSSDSQTLPDNPPRAKAYAAAGKQRRAATLTYDVRDDGGFSSEVITISASGKRFVQFTTSYQRIPNDTPRKVRAPSTQLRKGTYRYCIRPHDSAGQQGTRSCAVLRIA